MHNLVKPPLYLSWAKWLGKQAAMLISDATVKAFGDHRAVFYSADMEAGINWFSYNECQLEQAKAAVVLISSQGLESHWQHYELGRLHGRPGVSCTPLLLDVTSAQLKTTPYAHLNCRALTNDTLLRIVQQGFHSDGVGEDFRGELSPEQAASDLGLKLDSLVGGFKDLQSYNMIVGLSEKKDERRRVLLEEAVRGLRGATVDEGEIVQMLIDERIPMAAYARFFDQFLIQEVLDRQVMQSDSSVIAG